MRIDLERTKSRYGASIVVVLGLTMITARPAWSAPKKPTPNLTATVTRTPTNAPTPSRTPTPLPSPTPAGLAVQISFPSQGSQIASDRVTVRGAVQGPAYTTIVVNDVVGFVTAGKFVANDVPLVAGPNAIIATARTSSGASAETQITVNATGMAPTFGVGADTTAGNAPLTVHFVPTWSGTQTARSMKIDFDGNGTIDLRPSDPLAPVDHTFSTPGLYLSTITFEDRQRQTYTATLGIHVGSPEQTDALFWSLWDAMNAELVAGNVSGALSFLTPEAREIYGEVFSGLIADMPAIVPTYSRPLRVTQIPGLLEYAVTRVIDGEKRTFFASAVLDADGVWRMDSF